MIRALKILVFYEMTIFSEKLKFRGLFPLVVHDDSLTIRLFLVVQTHFQFVKPMAIHAVDITLGNDGFTVGFLDDAEDVDAFMFAAHDQDNLHSGLGVPACALEHGTATVCLLNDIVGDFLPLLADDHELHTLARVVDDTVGSDRVDHHEDETVHDLVDGVEQQP